jgi:hypothetical protein
MSERFYNTLTGILSGQQLSISSISRELKKHGYDYHRLIITGYLRALEDIGYVRRKDIPPSKVYTYLHVERGFYEVLAEKLENVSSEERLTVAVFLLTSLLARPCFKHELKLLGIPNPQPNRYVCRSPPESVNGLRSEITKINIPPNDPAFEFVEGVPPPREAVDVLLQLLKEYVNLDGLRARHQQTTLV